MDAGFTARKRIKTRGKLVCLCIPIPINYKQMADTK